MMTSFQKKRPWIPILSVLIVCVLSGGCRRSGIVFSDHSAAVYGGGIAPGADKRVLQVGDLVTIHYLPDSRPDVPQPFEDRIKEDGTITLPLIGPIDAAGKTARELGQQLRESYPRLGIVLPPSHEHAPPYEVTGAVKQPGPKMYIGETTVTKAIQGAGGFAEFANKQRIKLIHPDGRTEIVNFSKAIEKPGLDPRVIPGDRVVVPRRFGFGP